MNSDFEQLSEKYADEVLQERGVIAQAGRDIWNKFRSSIPSPGGIGDVGRREAERKVKLDKNIAEMKVDFNKTLPGGQIQGKEFLGWFDKFFAPMVKTDKSFEGYQSHKNTELQKIDPDTPYNRKELLDFIEPVIYQGDRYYQTGVAQQPTTTAAATTPATPATTPATPATPGPNPTVQPDLPGLELPGGKTDADDVPPAGSGGGGPTPIKTDDDNSQIELDFEGGGEEKGQGEEEKPDEIPQRLGMPYDPPAGPESAKDYETYDPESGGDVYKKPTDHSTPATKAAAEAPGYQDWLKSREGQLTGKPTEEEEGEEEKPDASAPTPPENVDPNPPSKKNEDQGEPGQFPSQGEPGDDQDGDQGEPGSTVDIELVADGDPRVANDGLTYQRHADNTIYVFNPNAMNPVTQQKTGYWASVAEVGSTNLAALQAQVKKQQQPQPTKEKEKPYEGEDLSRSMDDFANMSYKPEGQLTESQLPPLPNKNKLTELDNNKTLINFNYLTDRLEK